MQRTFNRFRRPPGKKPSGFVQDLERVRLPRPADGEMFAQVVELSGGSRMVVTCEDGKERIARIPGRVRRKIWIKSGDYVIIKPWSVEGDEKSDFEYRYTNVQSESLKSRGLLKM